MAKKKVKKQDWEIIDDVSTMGYRDDSPYRNRESIDIYSPNGLIDMSETGMPILANGRYLPPYSGMHQFNPGVVREERIMQDGGDIDPEMLYKNKYNTPLNKRQTKKFNKWVEQESIARKRDILMDLGAYDVQGFWKSKDYKNRDSDGHGSDRWKKPNHPTFSNQSVYSGVDGNYGGEWKPDGAYLPSKQTLDLYGEDYLRDQFLREPNRPEYLDMSRFESGQNKPTPLVYKTGGSIPIMQTGGRIPKAQIGTLTPGNSIGINMPTDLEPLTGLDLAFSKQERIPIQGNEELYNTVINNPERYNFRIVDGRFFNYLPKEENPIQIESKKADLLQSQSTTPRKLEFTRERQPGERFSALYTPQGQKYSAIDVKDKSGKLIRTIDPITGKIAFKHPVTGEEQFEYGGELPEAGSGYKVVRSSERKGKTHKVTGPDGTVKFFGDSKLGQHPKDPERKKAFYARHKKNLDGNPYFRAFARKTWKEGGELTENDIPMAQNGYSWSPSKQIVPLVNTENINVTEPYPWKKKWLTGKLSEVMADPAIQIMNKKYGNPEVSYSNGLASRANYVPSSNTMYLHLTHYPDFVAQNVGNKDAGIEDVQNAMYDKYFSELAHAKQTNEGKYTFPRFVKDWIKSPYLTRSQYDNGFLWGKGQYETPGTMEYEAHKKIEPELWKEYASAYTLPIQPYTQKAPLPGQSVPTMDFAQGGKIKVKSQDWEILNTAQDGRSLTSSELASRFRPEDAYQRSPIKFENIGNKSYGFGIRPNNFNISGVLDLQNKENPTFRTALGYNKNGLNINIAPSFSKDKKEAIFTAGYDGRDWSGNLMYQDPSKFNLGFGYNKAGFSGNANYERQGKNNVFNTSIGYEGEDVPINAGLDYTYDNGHYASANLGFNAKNIRGGFNYDYDQSEKANRFGLNLGTNFGKNKKWAFDTSANFDTDKNYKINTGLKYNFKSGGMLPDLNSMAFGGNLILEKYQDGGSNWEILPQAQGGTKTGYSWSTNTSQAPKQQVVNTENVNTTKTQAKEVKPSFINTLIDYNLHPKEGQSLGETLMTDAVAIAPFFKDFPGYKKLAYTMGSQGAGATRSPADILDGSGNYDGTWKYTSEDFDDSHSYDRNLLKNYIYGDTTGFEKNNLPPIRLDRFQKKYGDIPSYDLQSSVNKKDSLNVDDIFKTSQLIHTLNFPIKKEFLDDLFKKNNDTIPLPYEEVDPYNTIDDVAGHMGYLMRNPKNNDEINFRIQDIWKFDPDDYSKKWGFDGKEFETYVQAKAMEASGKPFILSRQNPVKFPNTEEVKKIKTKKQIQLENDLAGEDAFFNDVKKQKFGGRISKAGDGKNTGYSWSTQQTPSYQPTFQGNYASSQTTGNRALTSKEMQANKIAAEKRVQQQKEAEYEARQAEYAARQARIKESIAAQNQPLSAENIMTQSQSTGDKMSFAMNTPFGNPKNYPVLSGYMEGLDYINPFKFVGDMGSGLGAVPYNVQQGNYGQAAIGVAAPLLTGALAGIGTQGIKQFVNNLANPFAGMSFRKGAAKQLPGSGNVDFSKYPSQLEAVQARAERLLSQKNKKGWNEQLTPELEERLSTAVQRHDVAGDYPGTSLGTNRSGRTETLVSKDANIKGVPLTESQKSMIAAHETGHYYSNSLKEGIDWQKYFDFSDLPYKTTKYLKGKSNYQNFGNEIRERAAQLKDYIAYKNNIPLNKDFKITRTQLDDALENYVKITGLDNSMTPFVEALKKKGDISGFLKEMNKRPLALAPAAIIGAGAAIQPKNEPYRNGGKIKPKSSNWEILPEAQGGKQMGIISNPRKDAYYTQPAISNAAIQQRLEAKAIMDQRAREVDPRTLPVENKQSIVQANPQGAASKALEIAGHPITAITNLNKYGRIPDYFSAGSTNPLEYAFDVVNPVFYANAAGRTLKNIVNPQTYTDVPMAAASLVGNTILSGNQIPQEWDEALVRTAGRAGDAVSTLPVVGASAFAGAKGFKEIAKRSPAVRELVYKGINPTGYGAREKITSFIPNVIKYSMNSDAKLSDIEKDFIKRGGMSESDINYANTYAKNRLDAWRLGLNLDQKYNTFEKIGEDTYRIDPNKIFFNETDAAHIYGDVQAAKILGENKNNPSYKQTLEERIALKNLSNDIFKKLPESFDYNMYPYWKQRRIVDNANKNFDASAYDADRYAGVAGGFRWDVKTDPENFLHFQLNDTWDLHPFAARGQIATKQIGNEASKALREKSNYKMLEDIEMLNLAGGKPFKIQNNFIVDPENYQIIKAYKKGGTVSNWEIVDDNEWEII